MTKGVFCGYCDKDKKNPHKMGNFGTLRSASKGLMDRLVCPACRKPGLVTRYRKNTIEIIVLQPDGAFESAPSYFRWPVYWPGDSNPFMPTLEI